MGHDCREDYYRNWYDRNGAILPQEVLDAEIERVAANLSAVLDALRGSPLAPRLVVFGSVARGRFLPGDIDVSIDLRVGSPTDERELTNLLRISRKHYGWLDPFVIEPDGTLLVRNETATSWTKAKGARALKSAIRSEGRPLSEVTYELDTSPASYDPVQWQVEDFRKRWADLMMDGLRPDVLAHWQRQHLIATAGHPFPEVNELFCEFAAAVPDRISDDIEFPGKEMPLPMS